MCSGGTRLTRMTPQAPVSGIVRLVAVERMGGLMPFKVVIAYGRVPTIAELPTHIVVAVFCQYEVPNLYIDQGLELCSIVAKLELQ